MGIIKKKVVSPNLGDYSFGLLGESGIGKTTTMVEICQKEFGDDGYAILNIGKEQGVDCLNGAAYVDVPDWKHFDAVVKEFVKNKDTEYPNLKVLVVDTLDQLIEIYEPRIIDLWNKENMGKQGFVPAKTMNGSWSGFGKAEDKLIQILLDKIWELKSVGITVWYTMHTKSREQIDPYSGQSYNILSTNMTQKYFNGFKTKIHVVGIACVDRTIETEKTGRKNIVNHKDITVNKIKSERRKVIFRDDNYGVDSKSRFAGIVNEVLLDPDEIIKALKDAIKKERNKNSMSSKHQTTKPEIEEPIKVESDPLPEGFEDETDDMFEDVLEETTTTTNEYPEDLFEVIKDSIKTLPKDKKVAVAKKVKEFGKLTDVPEEGLKEIFDMINK